MNLLIDLPADQAYHAATIRAIDHAAEAIGRSDRLEVRVVPTPTIDQALIDDLGHGVVIGPGSPYESPERVADVILSARERGVPLVGT